MYEHFQPSEQVFVDREEYLDWMSEALKRCRDQSVVLHLRGIGGIGKSALLNHWMNTVESAIRLDCLQYQDFYSRLNVLAKGAALLGIRLQRFDVLWQIRQRFVEGVEPVKQEGREWAKEIAMAIPFIGSLASIGSAISAAGSKIAPKLKGRYSIVGKWLENRLGKNHVERLLEILWKEPRNAEFLYLDALLEDLNSRNNLEQPILFLFDHFEYVEYKTSLWRYGGKKINEGELWCVFLSSLNHSVGVLGSRRSSPATGDAKKRIEEKELTELDEDSTCELLEKREVTDNAMQEKIVGVSGGNPFVIDAICDMKDAGTISLDDVECLRAETLDEVRLMTWRRLFNMAVGLQDIINRAGLLEFFNRDVMNIIAPSMTTDLWDQLLRLSFVRLRDDSTWVLHDLARELIIAELDSRGKSLAEEVAQLLEKESDEKGDLTLIGHAFSIRAIFSEEEIIAIAKDRINDLIMKDAVNDALLILETIKFRTIKGQAEIQGLRGKALWRVSRIPEAEDSIRAAISINEELAKDEPERHLSSVAENLNELYELLADTRVAEAFDAISKALEIQRTVAAQGTPKQLKLLARILLNYGLSLTRKNPLDGITPIQEAIVIYKKVKDPVQIPYSLNVLGIILVYANKWVESEEANREAIELQRKLVESEPDNLRHRSILAAMINNMAFLTEQKGDAKASERLWNEALQIRRSLADKDPEVFLQRLEGQLENSGFFFLKINKIDEAEKIFLEELKIGQENVEKSPEVYQAWIEGGYLGLGLAYGARGKISEAIASIDRAISSRRKRIELGANVLTLGNELNISAIMHMKNGNYEKAEKALLEAIQLLRDYETLPPVWLANLAHYLNNHGILLWRGGRLPEAKTVFEESLEIAYKKVPEFYNGLGTLSNFAVILADNNELEAAEHRFQSALSIAVDLAQKTPEQYKYHHAILLHNYSHFLCKADRQTEAVSLLKMAIKLKHELVNEYPGIFETSLSVSLGNLAIMNGVEKREMEWEEKYMMFVE